jgi:hypothetical protein
VVSSIGGERARVQRSFGDRATSVIEEWACAPEHLDPVVAADAALAVIQPVLRGLTAG